MQYLCGNEHQSENITTGPNQNPSTFSIEIYTNPQSIQTHVQKMKIINLSREHWIITNG